MTCTAETIASSSDLRDWNGVVHPDVGVVLCEHYRSVCRNEATRRWMAVVESSRRTACRLRELRVRGGWMAGIGEVLDGVRVFIKDAALTV